MRYLDPLGVVVGREGLRAMLKGVGVRDLASNGCLGIELGVCVGSRDLGSRASSASSLWSLWGFELMPAQKYGNPFHRTIAGGSTLGASTTTNILVPYF